MKHFEIYEHIKGLPDFLDRPDEELTAIAYEQYETEEEVENFVKYINKILPTDKYDRERNLYVWWYK